MAEGRPRRAARKRRAGMASEAGDLANLAVGRDVPRRRDSGISLDVVEAVQFMDDEALDSCICLAYTPPMPERDPLLGCTGFEWDEGNATKSWKRHRVGRSECEEVFFLEPLVVEDEAHSQKESRFYALGKTSAGRPLFVVFTVRGDWIRVISARPMSQRERRVYEQTKEEPKS